MWTIERLFVRSGQVVLSVNHNDQVVGSFLVDETDTKSLALWQEINNQLSKEQSAETNARIN
jgi:hypothetical protein